LRTSDALHVATALDVGSDLGVIITYDQRLAAAAVAHGLQVAAPT
jgi:predicted nucleic acid-binding protein